MQDGHLLFEGHAREGVLHPFFKRLRLVEVDGHIAPRLLNAAAASRQYDTKQSCYYNKSVFHSWFINRLTIPI